MSYIHIHISDDPYTRIRNSVLQDKRLSFAARGVLAYLFSKPAGWVPRMYDLEKEGNFGTAARKKVMRELRDLGYAWTEKTQTGTIYHVTDIPQDPPVENRTVRKATGGKSTPIQTKDATNERKNTNKRDSSGMDLEIDKSENGMSEMVDELDADDFGLWWAAYPKQIKRDRAAAAYRIARKKTDAATLLRAAEGYAHEVRNREQEYIHFAHSWLRQELWDDYDTQKKSMYIYEGIEIELTEKDARDIGAKKKGD